MSYLAFCTFDLKNASSQDYKNAYADLEEIGLTKVQKSERWRRSHPNYICDGDIQWQQF